MDSYNFGTFLFLSILFGTLCYEILMYLKGKSSSNWRLHPATVTNVVVKTRSIEDESDQEESRACIKYEYYYLGVKYKGDKLAFGDLWSSNFGNALGDVAGIVRGSKIEVYVNPKRPNQSVFYNGYRGNIVVIIFFFLSIGAMAMFAS